MSAVALLLATSGFYAFGCLIDAECDDGAFCNGVETCNGGVCEGGAEACPGKLCDEITNVCVGTGTLQARLGEPLPGLTVPQKDRFASGKMQFDRVFSPSQGLGPVFNQHSCGSCHNTPLGGSGSITVTRFGYIDDEAGTFDPLESYGGSLRQELAIRPECAEVVAPEANRTSERLTNSTLGFGLVEAIPDSDIEANETTPPPGVNGRVHYVQTLENPGPLHVGRFGWKAQVATVLTFSADAALNEMGITNRFVTTENDPNGVRSPSLGSPDNCDTIADPEDGPDSQGFHFIDHVTDFQRFLASPPQTPRSGMTGETYFTSVGCAKCHMPSFTTSNNPALEPAIRNKTLHPYSDFLLHDMGLNADFIEQGGAGQQELRTPPLWGLRVRDPMWHDGRVAGGTFANRINSVIALHNDNLTSEGQASTLAYNSLTSVQKSAVIAFLDSLGRAEFDDDGDGDADASDLAAFRACFTGSGSFLTPDDHCSIHDADEDGDVDGDDFDLFLAATTGGRAGEVPDGSPGPALTVSRATGGQVTLSWGGSCVFTDGDYGVYEGTIGNFSSHTARLCTTGGATTATLTPTAVNAYYLVVPSNTFREGSYGTDSAGGERPAGGSACFPQLAGGCQ